MMKESIFKQEMLRADGLREVDLSLSDYFSGYKRGLQRAYHGEKFGTIEEHENWLGLYDLGQTRRLIGLGYRHGLKGQIFNGKDYCQQGAGDCVTCSLVNHGKDCHNNPV